MKSYFVLATISLVVACSGAASDVEGPDTAPAAGGGNDGAASQPGSGGGSGKSSSADAGGAGDAGSAAACETKPVTCASVGGAAGACGPLSNPQVAKYKDSLPQSTCTADERCVPCVSPLDGKATGACDARACAPAGDAGAAGDAGKAPAPADGGAKALACSAAGPRGQYTGVCLSESLDLGAKKSLLSRGTCTTGQLCAPCTVFGQPTGAPGC